MTDATDAFSGALAQVPLCAVRTILVRCVALAPLAAKGTPDFLFTSGQANRYNPRRVECVHVSWGIQRVMDALNRGLQASH